MKAPVVECRLDADHRVTAQPALTISFNDSLFHSGEIVPGYPPADHFFGKFIGTSFREGECPPCRIESSHRCPARGALSEWGLLRRDAIKPNPFCRYRSWF